MKKKRVLLCYMVLIIFVAITACTNKNVGNGELKTLAEVARGNNDKEAKCVDYESLAEKCQNLIEEGNTAFDTYLYYGEALLWLENSESDLKHALRLFKRAAEMDSNSQEAVKGIIDAYIKLEDYESAEEALRENSNLSDTTREDWLLEFSPQENGWKKLRDSDNNVRRISYYEDGICTQYIIIRYCQSSAKSATDYSSDGLVLAYVDYAYDEAGNEIRGFETSGETFFVIESEYNGSNRCINEKRYYPSGELFGESKYTYYEDGTLKTIWFKCEPMKSLNIIEYDKDGKEEKSTSYNMDGSIKNYTIYEYEDNLDRWILYNADGSIKKYHEITYDKNHDWIMETDYDASGKIIEQRKRE